MSCLGVMNLKSPNRITVTASNAKGEIGFVSNTNVQQKLTKVKATVANIPVGTESMQKLSGKHAYPHTHTSHIVQAETRGERWGSERGRRRWVIALCLCAQWHFRWFVCDTCLTTRLVFICRSGHSATGDTYKSRAVHLHRPQPRSRPAT